MEIVPSILKIYSPKKFLYDRKQQHEAVFDEMKAAKEELSARMNESHLGDIVFGTICGTIAAGLGFLASPVLGAIPGLLNAIYSACRIERPESTIDQTGLKYLALVDKRLRRKSR